MRNCRGSERAKLLLNEIGFDDISGLPMKIIVAGLGATLIEEPLNDSDGKIVRGKTKTLIKVNSQIPYEGRKRFTIAHEIGHLLMHDKLDVHNDNANTLNWFNNTEKQLQKGYQEWEANDFASELLMPKDLFIKEVNGKKFSPMLLKQIAQRFNTTITATVFRYLQLDISPLFISFISNGVVKYWRISSDFWVKVKDINKLAPPSDSVASEYIEANYEFIYQGDNITQIIGKSTWFELKEGENDSDYYEYCIPTKQYKSLVSIVWRD